MLTPSDKTILITKAIEVLKCAEGVDRPFLKEMTELLESAEEEEVTYQLEQDDYMKSQAEVTQTDINDSSEYWESKIDQVIQQQIDRIRGK